MAGAAAKLSDIHINSDGVRGVFESLQCPVCLEVMSSKIHSCINGHNVCENCKPNIRLCPTCRAEFTGARNYLVEQLVSSLEYPCENWEAGCQEVLTINKATQHMPECLYRKYRCFSRGRSPCGWRGLYPDIKGHISEVHGNSLYAAGEIVFPVKDFSDLSKSESECYFMEKFGELFVMYYNRKPPTGRMYFVVQYIGPVECASRYQYSVQMNTERKTKEMILRCDTHTDKKAVEELHKSEECLIVEHTMASHFTRYGATLRFILSILKK